MQNSGKIQDSDQIYLSASMSQGNYGEYGGKCCHLNLDKLV